MQKKSLSFIPLVTIIIFIFGVLPALAASGHYRYISTELGTRERYISRNEHEVVDPRASFGSDETVLIMTKISNITGIGNFQFKYELYGLDSSFRKTVYTSAFAPNYQNWPGVISAWNYFEHLPDGRYEVKILININNGNYATLDAKTFDIGSRYSDREYCDYHDCSDRNYDYSDYGDNRDYNQDRYPYNRGVQYEYGWTHTGTNVKPTGQSYAYDVVNAKTSFTSDEEIYALTKLSNINGINNFKIKFDVYQNGSKYLFTKEAAEQSPSRGHWDYNFSWANLGRLNEGSYQIRINLSVNGRGYTELDRKTVSVTRPKQVYKNFLYDYRYSWTQPDSHVRHVRGYIYDVTNPRLKFYDGESIMALTKLSDIKNISNFRVKHELYRKENSAVYRKSESPVRRPNHGYWEYNYYDSDFGRLPAGDYQIKVYLSINGQPYKLLESKTISVERKYHRGYGHNGRFDRTRTDDNHSYAYRPDYRERTGYDSDYTYYRNPHNQPYQPYYYTNTAEYLPFYN